MLTLVWYKEFLENKKTITNSELSELTHNEHSVGQNCFRNGVKKNLRCDSTDRVEGIPD